MSIMTATAPPSSESYESCLSEFTQSDSGSMAGVIKSERTTSSDELAKNREANNPKYHSTQNSVGEEKLDIIITHDHCQVPPDSPTLAAVDGEISGEIAQPLGHVHSYYSDPESDQELDDDHDDDHDIYALANRIRLLIQTLASRSRPMPDTESSPMPQVPERILRDSVTGQPVPFADAAFLSDTELIAKLKNGLIMNGMETPCTCTKCKGEVMLTMTKIGKKSVWAVLDSFKAPPAHHWCADLPEHLERISNKGGLDTHRIGSFPTTVISDDSSVMMCFPLVADPDSKVELAKSSIVTISPVDERPKMKKMLKKYRMYVTFGNKIDNKNVEDSRSWKFWKKKGTLSRGASSVSELNVATPEDQPAFTSRSLTSLTPDSKTDVKQRVWMPSTTKMSVQALWWGYRIFLPPPVLAVLSDDEVEATKRVALITAALTWFFSNIPITALPLPMQPAIFMLQKLLPYLGYIGTFISWSWDSIRKFDTGHGVILSATWLLPVALIPGTWEAYDFPVQSEESLSPSRVNEGEQDPKLDFALRLPLPPSSTSLSSASVAPSRSGLSALPLSKSEIKSVTPSSPRQPPVPITPSKTPVPSPSLITATRSSKFHVSDNTPMTPPSESGGFDTSIVQDEQEISRLASECSISSPPQSITPSTTDSRMTTLSSFSTTGSERLLSTVAPPHPPRSEARISPSSSITLSPTTLHAAARAAEMLQMLNDSESGAEKGGKQDRTDGDGATVTENNARQDMNLDVEAGRGEIDGMYMSSSTPSDGEIPNIKYTDGKTPASDVKTDAVAREMIQQETSITNKGIDVESKAAVTKNVKNANEADGEETGRAMQASSSTRSVKVQKENIPPSPVSAEPFIMRTPSKPRMTSSSIAKVSEGDSQAQDEAKKGGDKKEKRKSRGMAVVGGLWRLLTGSGNGN